jgi:hypothetical protein
MGKKISSNILDENRSESMNISEENFISFVEKEMAELHLHIAEPNYFFKGAVLSFFFCIAFWIILFWLIN